MFKTIVAATDGSAHSRRAMELAAGLAAAHGSRLVLVHVVGHGEVPEGLRRMAEVEHLVENDKVGATQPANVSTSLAVSEYPESVAHRARLHELIADRVLADAHGLCSAAGVRNVSTAKETGDPGSAVLDRARAEKADLIVLGTRGMSELRGLLMGSVSHKICQLSECPCLLAK